MLCFRCQHRVENLETGNNPFGGGPRFECGLITESISSCYCFLPVKPVVVKKNKGDKRPLVPGFARLIFVRDEGKDLEIVKVKGGHKLIWR